MPEVTSMMSILPLCLVREKIMLVTPAAIVATIVPAPARAADSHFASAKP